MVQNQLHGSPRRVGLPTARELRERQEQRSATRTTMPANGVQQPDAGPDGGPPRGREAAAGPPRNQASTPRGTKMYACEWLCGFKGPFNDVVHHERGCPARTATHEQRTGNSGPSAFQCEWKCGFKSSVEAVTAHEKSCALRADQDTPSGRVFKVFGCEFQCGYTGLYAHVLQHESSCSQRPRPSSISPMPPASAFSDNLAQGTPLNATTLQNTTATPTSFMCERRCGFYGSYIQVEEHETSCTAPPAPAAQAVAYTCQHLCGFSGSFAQVSQHEESCPDPRVPTVEPATGYGCALKCGFSGTDTQVARHQQLCTFGVRQQQHASTSAMQTAREREQQLLLGDVVGLGTYVGDSTVSVSTGVGRWDVHWM